MSRFGNQIRERRKEVGLQLRKVAASLDVDQAILSKIERGHRRASRKLVVQLAKILRTDKEELLITWLSDRLLSELQTDPDLALKALSRAEEAVENAKFTQADRKNC